MDSNASDARRTTRFLLRCGMVVGPLYLAVAFAQIAVRDGFDLARHPLSVLANGPGGWVQTANFAVTGVLLVATAVGFARALGQPSRGVTWCLGGYGVAVFLAALFPADPVDGFPPGTPLGMPTSISTTGLLHFACGAFGFLLLGISCFFAARAMARRQMPGLAWLSLASGLIVVFGFFGGVALPIGIAGIWAAVVVGWVWLGILSYRLSRLA